MTPRETTDSTSESDPAVESAAESEETAEPAKKLNGQAILQQMGGVSGVIYSSLPVLVFVPVSTYAGLVPAIVSALAVAAVILVWRLIRRETLQPAISGFIGVGVSALIAWIVGASKGYFLLGIWSSLLYAAIFAVSILIRRPIVGYVWTWANGRDRRWRSVRKALYAFDLATLTWVLVFGARFLVQNRLYDSDQTGLLGVARIAMGWPLTAVAALVTYLAIRTAQRALHAADGDATQIDTAQIDSKRVETSEERAD